MGDASPPRRVWKWAGPKARAYGLSRAGVAVCIGPTGGGKTTESARRILRVAQWQHPSPRDGIRKARILVLAPTYRRLWDQVLPSYFKVIDRSWGVVPGETGFRGARGDPADHFFAFQPPTGGLCYVEVLFRAVGDIDLEEFFRGFEVTAVWLPEMDTHETEDLLSFAQNRVGRYPEPDDRPSDPTLEPAYAGVYGDANAPVIGSWFFERFYLRKRAGDQVIIQPSGFSPNRENWDNLRKINQNYYEDMASKLDAWAVKRLIENKPGYSRFGQPVHEYFDIERMVAPGPLEASAELELLIGADCGNTLVPAAGFLQRSFGMQVRQFAEVVPMGQMDIMEFGTEIRRIRETQFAHVRHARLVVDPSARGSSVTNRQLSFAHILSAQTGLEVALAPTNDPRVRRTALDQVMKRSGGPGEPGFIVDPRCTGTIEALAGGYAFQRRGNVVSPLPAKVHPHCDIAEADQYGVLGMEGLGLGGGLIHAGGPRQYAEDHPPILQE